MILFPFIILSLLYKKIDKKSICFITIFENESKSRNKYHIFSNSTEFDNFSLKNNQKKSTSISEVLFSDKISVYSAFSAVVSVTIVVSVASLVASTAVVTAAVPAS